MTQRLSQRHNQPGVDMTPMLDIVFIMLIFFVVTATFIKEMGLTINHPHGGGPDPSEPLDVIGFRIDATDRVFFKGHLVDFWAAEALIKQHHTENPRAPVVLSLEQGSKLKTMVRLYDAAYKSGVPRGQVAVVTDH